MHIKKLLMMMMKFKFLKRFKILLKEE